MSEPDSSGVPPPRYEERGNRRHLITDEQEWLARPAQWGIDLLPQSERVRKQGYFDWHYYSRLTDCIRCEACRALVAGCFAEDGSLEVPEVVPENRVSFDEWYAATHPAGVCGIWPQLRGINHYKNGLITATELYNKLVDMIFGMVDQRCREEQTTRYWDARRELERYLALELVGPNPFRPVAFDPNWRTSTAVALARQMYETRDFSLMPILADALQDAGCEQPDILAHCRAPGPHVRGCWVVDLILGKS